MVRLTPDPTLDFHGFEVDTDGPWYSVRFPDGNGSYYITHTQDPQLALADVDQFIAEATVAREALEALA